MSKITLTGNASGTGVVTLTSPNTDTNRTITLPDGDVTLGVPSGIISMWSGLVGAIPSGWVICDGTNSTPNLTDKFIKAAATAGGTGGSATTGATTLATSQIPSHTHPYEGGQNAQSNAHMGKGYYGHNFLTSQATGGGGSHTHTQAEPVYFSLIFIMKT